MDSTMRPTQTTYSVTITLRHVSDRNDAGHPVPHTLVNTITAPDAQFARVVGETIGASIAAGPWVYNPAEVAVAELDDEHIGAISPLMAAVEQELLHSEHAQRALAATIAKYGPVSLTQDEYNRAVPGAVAQVIAGGVSWWVLPHQLCVPLAVRRLPALPENGVVAATDLHEHPGREVLVSSSDDPTVHVPASRWSWRTIIDVKDHPAGPAWRLLLTDQGAQAVIAAGAYPVRDPRPAPREVGELDG